MVDAIDSLKQTSYKRHTGIRLNLNFCVLFLLVLIAFSPLSRLMPQAGYAVLTIPFFLYALTNIKKYPLELGLIVVHFFCFLVSGKMFERGFGTPIQMLYREVYLFIGVMSVGMVSCLSTVHKKILVKAFFIASFLTFIASLLYCMNDIHAIRYHSEELDFIITFSQYYSLLYLLPILFIVISSARKGINNKILVVLLAALCAIVVILGQFATNIVLMCLSLVLFFILKYSKMKPINLAILLVLLLLAFLIFRPLVAEFFYWIATKATVLPVFLSSRFRAIGNLILGYDNNISTLGTRNQLIANSISSFFQNPVFGVGYWGIDGKGLFLTVGFHAEWTDQLASFGAVNFIVIIIILAKAFKSIIYNSSKNVKVMVVTNLVMFIVLGFLDPSINLHSMLLLFVIQPCVIDLVTSQNIMVENKYLQVAKGKIRL